MIGRHCVLLAAISAGCTSPPPLDPSAPRVTYYESSNPDTVRQEALFTGSDGALLGYVRHFGKREAALVYLHGIESHGAWFDGPADMLCGKGFDVFCLDRRGSGINRENRGFASGHVDSYETLIADIHAFVEPIRERYRHVFLVGLSWGGKLALAHALLHPGDCDGLVLITPGLQARVDLGLIDKARALVASGLAPTTGIAIPIEPEMFTRDPEFLEKMRRDPLRLHEASARFFLQSHALDELVDDRISRNGVPILLFLAGHDEIVDNEGVVELLRRGPQELDVRVYDDQMHSIQFDAPARLVRDMTDWLRGRMQFR